MTHKGEQMTVKGEYQEYQYQSKKDLLVSYSKDFPSLDLSEIPLFQNYKTGNLIFQMVFVVKGSFKWGIKDRQESFATLENQQHNLMLIDPISLIMESPVAEDHEIIFIRLSNSFLSRYLPEEHPAHQQLFNGVRHDKPALFSDQNMHMTPEMNAILNSIANSPHTGFCERLFLESKVIELLALQVSQFELLQKQDVSPQLKKDELDKVHEVREILINNIDSQFSLRTLAHMVGTNEFNLKKHFKTVFGTTVYGYLTQYKMEQAKAMLIQGDLRISEVSGKMGYKHATHFSSAFKRYFGYLPNKIKMLPLLFDPEFCMILFSV